VADIEKTDDGPSRQPLWAWLWPVPVGLWVGSVYLAAYVRGPGDPTGHVIGAGVGGTIGLVAGLILRAWQE
jgi:hypothetical protein